MSDETARWRRELTSSQGSAQHREDELLRAYFADRVGGFIDVGAYDGVTISNTLELERDGWKGICVEANPGVVGELRANRRSVVAAACVADASTSHVVLQVDPVGLLSGIEPLPEVEVAHRYARRGLEFAGFKEVEVPTTTLSKVADQLDEELLLVSVDVEGTELDVLRGLDFTHHRPEVFIVEANTDDHRREIVSFMRSHGYHLAVNVSVNVFFASDRGAANRLRALALDMGIASRGTAGAPTHPLKRLRRFSAGLLRWWRHRPGRS